MEEIGVKADRYTYCYLFKGIKNRSHSEYLDKALEIIKSKVTIIENSQLSNSEVDDQTNSNKVLNNLVLNACINCGEMQKALDLLETMTANEPNEKPDEISYNTIIKGCARAKQLKTAFAIFNSMTKNGLKPNEVTYNSLIDACVRSGKMDQAWDLFEQMEKR